MKELARNKFKSGGFVIVLAGIILAPTLIVLLYHRAPHVSFSWDLSNLSGFVATGCLFALFIFPGRSRSYTNLNPAFLSRLHKRIGYLIAFLLVLHISLLLLSEPLLWHYLVFSAPYYMLSGLAALVFVAGSIITAIIPVRIKIWPRYNHFKLNHRLLSIFSIALCAIHIIGSGYYINTPPKAAAIGVGVLISIGMIAIEKKIKEYYRK